MRLVCLCERLCMMTIEGNMGMGFALSVSLFRCVAIWKKS